MQFKTKLGLVDIPNEDVIAAARELDFGASPVRPSTGPAFVRERRYFVIKISDAARYLDQQEQDVLNHIGEAVGLGRRHDGRSQLECLVIESDWPEYEPTWAAIEARMSSINPQTITKEKKT